MGYALIDFGKWCVGVINFMRNYWLITLLMLTGCIPPPTYAPAPLPNASSPPLVYKTRVLETPSRGWCEKNVPQDGRPQWLITNEYSHLCPEQVVAVSSMRPTTPLPPLSLPSPPLYMPLPVPPSPENYRVPPAKGKRTAMVARKTQARPQRTLASKIPTGPRTVAVATKTPEESQTTASKAPTVESVSDPTPPKAVAGQCSNGQIWVNSYTREDGTLVSGYCKSQQPAKVASSLKALAGHCGSGQIWVKPYTREDGTLVSGYCKHHRQKKATGRIHSGGETWVKSYIRKDGTRVNGYKRKKRTK